VALSPPLALEVAFVVEPEVFSLVELEVSEPGVAFVAASPEVFALVFAAAELSPEVVVFVVEPEVFSLVELEVSEPGVPFVAAVSVAASPEVDAVAAISVDSPGRPKFLAFPNVDQIANPSSSVAVVG
jgi:hypothetical protein